MTPDGLRRTREHLDALYNISRVLNSTLQVESVLQNMLDMVLEIFEADAGSVMLVRGDVLTIEVCQGLAPEIVAATRQPLGVGIAGWVALNGVPLHLDGKVNDPRFSELVERDDDIVSSLCVPIRHRRKTTGVVMIRREAPRPFEQEDLPFLESVSDLAAVALENARLFESESRQRELAQLEHQKLKATLASMADGVVVVDKQGSVLMENRVALGFLEPLYGEDVGRVWSDCQREFKSGQTRLEAGARQLQVTATPLFVEGQEAGSVLVFRDETARHELEKMKSEFLSMVSHELKTPITTVGAFLELLLTREFPPVRQKRFLEICNQECERLHTLIDQLLQLSRLETGRFELKSERKKLGELVGTCLPAFRESNFGHQFKFAESAQDPELQLDPVLVTQAITNLLSNAVKYSPEGGVIEIGIRVEGRAATLWVKDQGVGIEAEKIPLVFEKFYRVDNSLTRETGGTGLGLANVMHIAQAHGGRAWVESQVGQGSTFFMEFPIESGDDTHVTG